MQKAFAMSLAASHEDTEHAELLLDMVRIADMDKIQEKNCPSFDSWLEALPSRPLKGFARECWLQVRYWSNGGGRYSATERMEHAIDELDSDSPQVLADAIFHSIVESVLTPFEASSLTMHIVDESLRECGV